MKLLDSDTKKFKELYVKHFNIELDDIEARTKLSLLVRQMEIVYQPITEQQFADYLEKVVDEADKA
jgi:hypothetical protein